MKSIKAIVAAVAITTSMSANAEFKMPSCPSMDFDSVQAIHSLKFAMKQVKKCNSEFSCKVAAKLMQDAALEFVNTGAECSFRIGYIAGLRIMYGEKDFPGVQESYKKMANDAYGEENALFSDMPRDSARSIGLAAR